MKKVITAVILFLLFYTRFVGINWGLPYHMHPDERNMAVAVTQLQCDIRYSQFDFRSCLNPRFYAYGQLPLYTAFGLIKASHVISLQPFANMTMQESILALRFISALCSLLMVVVVINMVKTILKKNLTFFQQIVVILIITYSPYAIQFAHFGTTESLLMLSYSYITYLSLRLMERKKEYQYYALIGFILGLTVGVKLSAILFGAVPFIVWITNIIHQTKTGWYRYRLQSKTFKKYHKLPLRFRQLKRKILLLISTLVHETIHVKLAGFLLVGAGIVGYIISSPHNIINFNDFLGSMRYESGVATGAIRVFYTRQFEYSIPILFHFVKVFPYAFGFIGFAVFLFGFFLLDWKNKQINLIRFAILAFFLPSAFLFAKWTRFISPVFALMTTILIIGLMKAHMFISKFQNKALLAFKIIQYVSLPLIVMIILPGVAYMAIYTTQDVRFRVSEYFYQNVEAGKHLFYETANVVDIPIPDEYRLLHVSDQREKERYNKQYVSVSFNFYDVDQEDYLKNQFWNEVQRADYIIIPSRRVFKNHICLSSQQPLTIHPIFSVLSGYFPNRCDYLKKKYPLLHDYYDKLWSGDLRFEKVAEYSSFPRISLFGKIWYEIRDEPAEETWTVFDHPVIRIYKRMSVGVIQ